MLGTGGYDVVQEILAGRTADAKTSGLKSDLHAAAAKQVGQPKARGGGCFWLLILIGVGWNYASDFPMRQFLQPEWWFAKIDGVLNDESAVSRAAEQKANHQRLQQARAAQAAQRSAILQANAQELLLRHPAEQAARQAQSIDHTPIPQEAQPAPAAVQEWVARSSKRLKMCLRSLRLGAGEMDFELVLSASGEVLDLAAVATPRVLPGNLKCMWSMLRHGVPPVGLAGKWRVQLGQLQE